MYKQLAGTKVGVGLTGNALSFFALFFHVKLLKHICVAVAEHSFAGRLLLTRPIKLPFPNTDNIAPVPQYCK